MTDSARFLGRSPETLTIEERRQLAGQWIALPLYSPDTLPLRLIEAIGASPADCATQLAARGRDASGFEYQLLRPAF